jgi:hypothetical protein
VKRITVGLEGTGLEDDDESRIRRVAGDPVREDSGALGFQTVDGTRRQPAAPEEQRERPREPRHGEGEDQRAAAVRKATDSGEQADAV